MNIFQTIVIGIVEGLTEFLPVSSTGHMIITQKLLGVPSDEFVKAFTIIIQFGAILSVVVLYYKRFFKVGEQKLISFPDDAISLWQKMGYWVRNIIVKYDFYVKLLIAFLPAAVLGLIFSDKIDELLESVSVVAVMLILGGVLMIFADNLFAKTTKDQTIGVRKALIIGLCQCIAMIPGVSRSMATIVGGMSQRLTRKNAAEFSFFLAVPTMLAASAWKLLKLIVEPTTRQILIDNIDTLIIGNIVAFGVALMAIRFFISFLTKYGFKAFGYYRIIVGVIILTMLFMKIDLAII